MSEEEIEYEKFSEEMHTAFPKIFVRPFGGFAIGPGWYQIIRSLCANIQSYIDSRECHRLSLVKSNPMKRELPEKIEQVTVDQIKEKFGGLRFYYSGGDEKIDGMVTMAESWAAHTCETCGKPGKSRDGGWIRTLCDEHEAERQKQMKE